MALEELSSPGSCCPCREGSSSPPAPLLPSERRRRGHGDGQPRRPTSSEAPRRRPRNIRPRDERLPRSQDFVPLTRKPRRPSQAAPPGCGRERAALLRGAAPLRPGRAWVRLAIKRRRGQRGRGGGGSARTRSARSLNSSASSPASAVKGGLQRDLGREKRGYRLGATDGRRDLQSDAGPGAARVYADSGGVML